MASINKVILVARLGKDPEIRSMPNGKSVANFSVATSRQWKNQNGEKQEETEWSNIITYNKLADIIGKYLRKGSQVYLEGRLQTRRWQDKEGKDRYTTEIICNEMQMLDGKKDGGGSSAAPVNQPTAGGGGGSKDMDEDIPFSRIPDFHS